MELNHVLLCHDLWKTDFVKAENNILYDAKENPYIDFESGCWSTVLGHNHPRISKRIQDQVEKIMHLNHRYSNHLSEQLARQLLDKLEIKNGKCTFLCSGSEAVTLTLKMARYISGRNRFLTLKNTYLAAYGEGSEQEENNWHIFDWNPCIHCRKMNCDQDCENFNQIPFDDLAGFVFEPGSASGTVQFPRSEVIRKICKAVKDTDGFLIANEVTTGIGKTGNWFGFQHYDIHPDIVSIGKGLGNGYPISSVALAPSAWRPLLGKEFKFAQSHTNDPLGCAVAIEVLAVIEDENLVHQSQIMGDYFLDQLKILKRRYSIIQSVRGRGLMLALEIDSHSGVSAVMLFQKLLNACFIVGFHPGFNVIRFYPSLTIEKEQIDSLILELDRLLSGFKSK